VAAVAVVVAATGVAATDGVTEAAGVLAGACSCSSSGC
jgi:hypothetical protein